MNSHSEPEACPDIALPYGAFPGTVIRLDRHRIVRGVKLEAAEQQLRDPGLLLGGDLSAIFPHDVVSALEESIGEVTSDGRSRTVRCRFDQSDGASRHSVLVLPMVDRGALLILEAEAAAGDDPPEPGQGEPGFRTAFDHVQTFIALTLPDGTLLDVNRAALEFCGARWSEVVGRPFWDGPWWTHSPELQENLKAAIREAAAGRTSHLEVTHVAVSGSTHVIDFFLTPVKDEAGRVVYLVPEGRDISTRKATYNALHHSEQMLRIVLDAIPQGVFWKDRTLRYLGCNRIAAADSGVDRPEAVVGKTDFDLAWRDQAEAYRNDDQAVIDSGQAKLNFEEALAQPNGSVRWVRTSKIPLRDPDGQVVGLLGAYEDITERKRVEEDLRESRELLRAILNTIPVRVFWKDKNLVYLGCNAPFAKDAGFESPEEIVGKDDFAMGWRSQADLYRADDLAVIESGQARLLIEEPQMTPSGAQIHLLTSKLPLRDAGGAIVGVLGTYLDITDRKRAEQALQQHAAQLQLAMEDLQQSRRFIDGVLNSMQDPIFVKNDQHKLIVVNDAFCRFLGIPRDQIIGRTDYDFFPEGQVDVFWEKDRLVLDTGVQNENEEEITDGLGEVHTILTKKNLFRDPVSQERMLVGIIRDITERKKLQMHQALLSAAIDSAFEAVVITDPTGTIEYANPASERVSGHLREDAVGQRASINKSGLHDERFYQNLWTELLAGRVWKGRFKNRRKDGTHYDEDATISPVFDEQGRIVHFVAVKRDVTKELCLEEQLRQSQKLEAIGTLAGGIAHDFNNMLTAIIGHASLLMTSPMDHQHTQEAAKEIVSTGNRAAALTRQLLAYSRRQETQLIACNLNDRLHDLAGMLRRLIGDDIELLLELGEDLKPIYMDATQLDQIVLNLVVNARDAIGSGGTIIVETANRTVSPAEIADYPDLAVGQYAVLKCWDDGAGMPATVAARIFDPFFTTKEQGKGTGLGLSTVYGIVKQAKGHVEVISKERNGTCFTVLLPTTADIPAIAESVAPPAASAKLAMPGVGTIVLAEASESVRVEMRLLLEANGYTILEAVTAEEAVLTVRHWPRDISLLLINAELLSATTGNLTAEIQDARPNIAVLYLSDRAADAVPNGSHVDGVGVIASRTPMRVLEEIRRLLAKTAVAEGSTNVHE